MKNIMILIGLLIISLSFAFSQVTPDAILPIDPIDDGVMASAYDITVVCNAPSGCPSNNIYTVKAFDGNNSVTGYTDESGFVAINMAGLPKYDGNGNLRNYFIMATPYGSDVPCGIIEKPYPTISVPYTITVTSGPCSIW